MNKFKESDRPLSNIIRLATAVPKQTVTQHDALSMSSDIICRDERQRRLLRMLFRKSGVANRRTVIPWQTAYRWNESADFSDA